MTIESAEVYEFGRFRLEVGEHKLVCLEGIANGRLTEKAFQTLTHLVRHGGALVTYDELLDVVWQGAIVEKNNVGKAIHFIRTVLGDTGDEPRFIETISKHGYRFIAEVNRIDVGKPPPGRAVADTNRAHSPAYDLYIRGKVKSGRENATDTDEAIKLLEAAVVLDPLLSGAFAHLARTYNTRAFKFSSEAEGKQFHERAEIALEKALDLDPNLAEAHFARGLILWSSAKGFPHEHAIRAFSRSLELNPSADETHHQLSMVFAHVGLLEEAQEHVRIAVEINPNNTMARYRIGVYTAWQCRFEDALGILKTVPVAVSPMLIDRTRAEVLVQLGRSGDAQTIVDDHLTRHPADEGGSFTSLNALLLARDGRVQETEVAIASAIKIGKGFGHFHHTAYNIAAACVALDRSDEAVAWLEAAAEDGFPCYPYFKKDPNLQRLHGLPRFVALMSTLRQRHERFRNLGSSSGGG